MRKPPDDLLTVARPSPDKPLTERADDRFQRWSFAANVARTIAHRDSTDALVVGLYGPWGEGKTTVLNFIEQAVAHETQTDPVVVLRFNPWRFTKEATLLSSFFDMLATGIGAKLRTGKEQLGELLEKYSAELSAISGQAGRIGAATEALSPSLDDLKRRIEVELEGFDRPVVVLIDDIDRLRRADIQLLFRLVTLTADFPRTTYILAFDPDIVADAMSEVYGYADPTAGSRFLEKIVHVPLHLPQVDQAELRSICIEGIEAALRNASIDLAESDRYRLARDLMQFVEPSLQTARTAKRVGRVLEFVAPLLKDEVNPSDLVLLECLHVLFPDVYGALVSDTAYFLPAWGGMILNEKEWEDDGKEFFTNLLAPYKGRPRKALAGLIRRLFPEVVGLEGFRQAFRRDDWARSQRICSEFYFSRYITYSVRPGDVHDAEIGELLASAADGATEDLCDRLSRALRHSSADRVISKLRFQAETLTAAQSRALLMALCQVSDEYEVPWPVMSFMLRPRSQAAVLVTELLANIPAADRQDVLTESMLASESPHFVLEVRRWLGTEDLAHLGEGLADIVSEIGLSKVTKLAETDPFFLRGVENEARLLTHWAAADPEAAADYVLSAIAEDPARLDEFLTRFLSRTTRSDSDEPALLDLHPEAFDSIASIVPPAQLAPLIEARFGLSTSEAEYREDYSLPPASRAASQYLAHYRRMLEREAAAVDADDGTETG